MLTGPAQEWEYKDPQGTVQGPFKSGIMLEWVEADLFPHDLPVKPCITPGM